jgi:hypothetical protein
MGPDGVAGAGELEVRLDGHQVDVVRVGLTSEAVEVDQRVRRVTLILNKLQTACVAPKTLFYILTCKPGLPGGIFSNQKS